MGNYSTMLMLGAPRQKYIPLIRAFRHRDLEAVLTRPAFRPLEPVMRELIAMPRGTFALRGSPSYVPREWHEWEVHPGLGCVGRRLYIHLVSSKDRSPHEFFARRIAPLIMRPGYYLRIGDYR